MRSLKLRTENCPSVLRYFRIDAIRPCRDSSGKIVHFAKAGLLQERDGFRATAAHLAMHDDLAARIEFVHALRQIVQRNQISADIADLILVRFAHVEHEQIFLRIQTPLQIFDLNLGNTTAHRFFLSSNAAKLVVVYQLRYRRMRPAHGAIRILAQLEFPELHAQRIDQQQAPDERIPNAQDQLDDFGRLHHANKSRENSQNSAFGAGGNQSRWWRLEIEAAVAGAILSREYARLSLEAENRSVNVRLARQYACIVHQIARREIIRAIGDDVELAE